MWSVYNFIFGETLNIAGTHTHNSCLVIIGEPIMTGKQMSKSNYSNSNRVTPANFLLEACLESLGSRSSPSAVENRL